MRFWDSSALIPLVVGADGSSVMHALLAEDPDLIIWWGSGVEGASAVHRLRREGVLGPLETAQVQAGFASVLDAANVVEPTDAIVATSLRLLTAHPLRAADSLQLAAAFLWTQDHPAGRDFVCLDARLRVAAALEGFRILPGTL